MDKKVLRERMLRKQRQMRRRKMIRLATYVVAMILVLVFVIRGIILPIVHKIGGKEPSETVQVQAQTAAADPDAAVRQPLKGQGDLAKASQMTPGWHEDENGKWYQNSDGTYYSGGFQDIDGVTYSFDENGYIQTGWVSKGVQDLYFNEDGSYNPEKKRPMLALTYDDGPGEYTQQLLDCLEENNAHATFFMLGQNVEAFPEAPKRMLEIGCEIGSHSYDHENLYNLSMEQVAKEFTDTDDALIKACGQAATVARAPYGNWSQDIIDTVNKPFFMWSLDSLDWSYKDVNLDYNEIMNGDLTDGSIILMHDIHEPSVQASLKIIPDLIAKGYKLVTVSELAEAKGVTLQNASYSDFWDSSLASGAVAGYNGEISSSDSGEDTSEEESSGEESYSDGSEDSEAYSDGEEDYSEEDYSDGESNDDESYSEDSNDDYSDGEEY